MTTVPGDREDDDVPEPDEVPDVADLPVHKVPASPESFARLQGLLDNIAKAATPTWAARLPRFEQLEVPELERSEATPQRQLDATEQMVDALSSMLGAMAEQRNLLAQQRDLIAEQRDLAVAERDEARADRAVADDRARTALRHSRWSVIAAWVAVVVTVAGSVVSVALGRG